METTLSSFHTLERICAKMFGPNGVATLIQGPTGSMSVTRRGWAVAQSIYEESSPKNLAMKIMLNNMKKVHKTLGDGVKSFLLTEVALLKHLVQIKKENQLSNTIIFHELQSILQALCDMEVVPINTVLLRIREDCEKATSALFSTSCPYAVSSFLHTVFHDWISMSLGSVECKSIDESCVLHLEFLLSNFDLLCYKHNNISRPASDSYVLPGYLIDRIALNMKNKEETQVHIELYTPDTKVDDIELLYDIKLLVKDTISKRKLQTLLLATAVLPEKALFELHLKNVIVLHGVSMKDIEFISFILYKSSHIPSNTIGIKSYVCGNKECTYLLLPTIYQLIICAPTDSLLCEYACICKNALKYLLVSARSNCRGGLITAGGSFEKSFYFHVAAQINKLRDPCIFFIHNRKELLQWHLQNQQIKSISSHKEMCHGTSLNNVSVIEESIGTMKISPSVTEARSLSELPNDHQFSITSMRNGCKEPKNCIPKQISSSNLKIQNYLFQNVDKNVLAAFSQSLLIICNHLTSECREREVFEAVSYKIQLWQHIIAAAIVFFKCDNTA